MSLDSGDRDWMEGRFRDLGKQVSDGFEAVHDRISRQRDMVDSELSLMKERSAGCKQEMSARLTRIESEPCSDVVHHVEEHHKGWGARVWTLLATIVATISTTVLLLKEFMR